MRDDPAAPPQPRPQPPAQPAPWGLVGTIAWGAGGVGAWFLVQLAAIVVFLVWRNAVAPGTVEMHKLGNDGFLLAVVVIVAGPAWVGVSVLAARLRGWRARDYLALIAPKKGEILFGIACLAPLLIGFDILTYMLGREVVPTFMREAYASAKATGSLPLFFIAVVIVGPIAEEIAFRGFLFRGLSVTWLGVAGTLLLTSGAWAAMHVQYDAFNIAQIFLIGLLLGWLRWASGSTLLTIMLHMLANLVATVEAAIRMEWLG